MSDEWLAREVLKAMGIAPTRSRIRAWIQETKDNEEAVEQELAMANLAPKPPAPPRRAAGLDLGRSKRRDPQQTAFWQKLPRETVVRLAEQYHLSITIRPDGSIIGLPADVKKLRLLLERRSKAKNKVQRSKKRRIQRSSSGGRSKTWRTA